VPAATAELDLGDLEVVLAPADPEAEGETPGGERVDAQRLLRQPGGVGAQRPEQDRGAEPDPLGHRRGGGERGQRLVVVAEDAVDRPEAGEAARLGPPAGKRGCGDAGAPARRRRIA
jgi:hypothetical protein